MFKLKHEPSARRSQFFMNLIICGFRRIHVKIYEIRGQRVMLDRDLAELFKLQQET